MNVVSNPKFIIIRRPSKMQDTKNVLNYQEKDANILSHHSNKRKRKRNIIFFNPPHNMNVSTNVGRYFLNAIVKHFGGNQQLKKLFNKNNVKVSYSCGQNIRQEIKGHNIKILRKSREETIVNRGPADNQIKLCNCTRGRGCPLDGKCQSNNIVYLATVKVEDGNEHYYAGQTITSFKKRWQNHLTSFNKAYKRKSCAY